jgi:hypothetical protein
MRVAIPLPKLTKFFFFECALSRTLAFRPAREPKSGYPNKSFENSNYRLPKSLLGGEISVT